MCEEEKTEIENLKRALANEQARNEELKRKIDELEEYIDKLKDKCQDIIVKTIFKLKAEGTGKKAKVQNENEILPKEQSE